MSRNGTAALRLSFLQGSIQFFACLYFFEVILGGPGSWSTAFLHFDIRRAFYTLICALLLISILSGGAKLRVIDAVALMLGIVAFTLWTLLLPWFHGANQTLSIADATPSISMFIISWLFLIQARHWGSSGVMVYRGITRFVFLTTIFSAAAHVAVFVFLVNLPDESYPYLAAMNRFFDAKGSGSLYIGPMPDGSTRVFWISSLFVVFGLYCCARNFIRTKSFLWIALAALFVLTIYITQTRSLVLGLPIGSTLALFLQRRLARGRASTLWTAVLITAILVSVSFFLVAGAHTDIPGLLGLSRGESDEGRNIQIPPLLEAWSESPLLGNGFGSHAAMTRSNDAPFSYEMSILALYMKVGILGAMLSSLYFVYLIVSFIPRSELLASRSKELGALFGVVFIFCFAFNTNPYLSNSVGVAIVFLCCIELAALSHEEPAQRRESPRRVD